MKKQIKDNQPGNVFNAKRDNRGEGIKIDDFIIYITESET